MHLGGRGGGTTAVVIIMSNLIHATMIHAGIAAQRATAIVTPSPLHRATAIVMPLSATSAAAAAAAIRPTQHLHWCDRVDELQHGWTLKTLPHQQCLERACLPDTACQNRLN